MSSKKMNGNNSPVTADTAVEMIQSYREKFKDPHGREMSWLHCYRIFSEKRNKTDAETIDYLSLHLAFYLASWGMYRASSPLLQKDYTVHIPVVEVIQKQDYNLLHGISAEELCMESSLDLLNDIAERIRSCYAKVRYLGKKDVEKQMKPTDTLVTKVLLGTLGCIPAFDQYYTISVRANRISAGTFSKTSAHNIAAFYCDHLERFEILRREINKCGMEYPPMKLMDMCFWCHGKWLFENNTRENQGHL